jgi:hypothetical protein
VKDEDGVESILPFETAMELLDNKIDLICAEVGATSAPTLYLTSDSFLVKQLNIRNKLTGDKEVEPIVNFRENVSKTKVYKGTRKSVKPFHFKNISAYMLSNYDCVIANGLEADDLMCIRQWDNYKHRVKNIEATPTIICSRDKDLRMCPGWHYSWECGKQASIGPLEVGPVGFLQEVDGKIRGFGIKFFFYQLLVGDSVDNIPGLPKCGPAKALKILDGVDTPKDMLKAVTEAYKASMGDVYKEYLREQANLLWMVRELDEQNNPVMFDGRYL